MMQVLSRKDIDFLLTRVLDLAALQREEAFSECGDEVARGVLDTAERLARDKFLPHAALSDACEPSEKDGKVVIIEEVKDALDAYIEAGFMGLSADPTWGGSGLPMVLTQAALAFFDAANGPTHGYAFLTRAAANLILAHGAEAQKRLFGMPLVAGRWFGTMCLSEPQVGSSLSDICTRAQASDDGSYLIKGTKMWISAGEHDLAENIVHLVLAKLPGGPQGVKGISLFIVPRFLVDGDGAIGAQNDITLVGLNHKMGNRGTVNTILRFGETAGAVGYLVGEPHRGLEYMFHMMNEARIGVGLGAAALGVTGYLHSLEYARNRVQGRPPGARDKTSPMVRLIEHADIRRMLLQQKALAEGSLVLCLFAARLVDESRVGSGAAAEEAELLLDLLTPIVKSWPAEFCTKANDVAIQVLGGAGYTRDFPLERFYRDNRLNPIHEGTKGIQAIDLLGRKIRIRGGAALELLGSKVATTVNEAQSEGLVAEARSVEAAFVLARQTAQALVNAKVGDARVLANATIFLDMLGHVVVGWLWLKMATAAQRARREPDADCEFLDGKLAACRYFLRYELPITKAQCDLLTKLDTTCFDMLDEWF